MIKIPEGHRWFEIDIQNIQTKAITTILVHGRTSVLAERAVAEVLKPGFQIYEVREAIAS